MPEVRWKVGPPDVGGCGSERWTDVGGVRLRILCIFCCLFPLGAVFCIHFVFLEDKLHVSKCEFSVLMKLFPNTSAVLGQNWRFQCKPYSQADCTSMNSGCPPMGASGVFRVRESLLAYILQQPHPALLA